jgi:hypothetical protein
MVCFVLGFLSVVLTELDRDSPRNTDLGFIPASTPTLQESPSAPPRMNIIVLGVDSLGSAQPQLRAVWTITTHPQDSTMTLTGFPVDYPLDQRGRNLENAFSFLAQGILDPAFIDELDALVPDGVRAFVLLDEVGFAELIDFMGGIRLNNEQLDGMTALGVLQLLYEQPGASLAMQAKILEALSMNAPSLGMTPELTPIMELIPEHALTTLPAPQLTTLVVPLLPLSPDRVIIRTWSAEDQPG